MHCASSMAVEVAGADKAVTMIVRLGDSYVRIGTAGDVPGACRTPRVARKVWEQILDQVHCTEAA